MSELKWAAGFFDGEGTTTLRVRGPRIKISLPQADPEVLDRFRRAVGGYGVINGPYSPRSHEKKDRYIYQTESESVVREILWKLWPYLSEPKREQARVALDVMNRRDS